MPAARKPKGADPSAAEATDHLALRYVPLDQVRRWERNPKRHDFGALIQSIGRYGFKDPPKFEPALNGGAGGIVEGNGRAEALAMMRDDGQEAPRGVAVDGGGRWCVPVLFGVDARSRAEAEAYGIDHNNLTLMGGDLGPDALLALWDEEPLAAILADAAAEGEGAISLDGDDLDALLNAGEDWQEGLSDELTRTQDGYSVRPLLTLAEVETLERAITKTGLVSRAEAFMAICRSYLGEPEV